MTQNKILTPFYYLAGAKTLIIGILFLAITSVLSYYSFCRFDGLIDIHFSKPVRYSFTRILLDQIISWLLISLFFYLGFLCSGGRRLPRLIDVFGTTLFARIPLIVIPLIVTFFSRFVATKEMQTENLIEAFIILISVTYYIALLYNAYKVCFNLGQLKIQLSFISILILGEFISSLPSIHHLLF